MSLIGYPDLDRPVTFANGRVYHPFGGGIFRLEPSTCAVASAADATPDFRLDLVRALIDRDSRAWLSVGLAPRFDSAAALETVRGIDPAATLAPCVLTHWRFRLPSTPGLRIPSELGEPVALSSDGLGSVRLMVELALESGQILESMLRTRTPLAGVALAQVEGVSPRLPLVARIDVSRMLHELLAQADSDGAMPRDAVVAYFAQDAASLPVALSGAVGDDLRSRFADTMADRAIARFGRYVAPAAGDAGLRVQLAAPDGSTTLTWALMEPVTGQRQVALPIDLLADAQVEAARAGIDAVVHRDTFTALPALGRTRITALCSVPAPRTGVDALGVNLDFPARLPDRPQPRSATLAFDPPDDSANADVVLAPGEPACYRYTTFATISDAGGTRQVESDPVEACGSPLRLGPAEFPLDFVLVDATPALAQLALVSGTVTYDAAGGTGTLAFTLASGSLAAALAVPRDRTSLRVDAIAAARDGSGALPLGPFDTLQVRLDVTSFAAYGPREVLLRCVFDDGARLRALSVLPDGLDESDANITTLSFTPAESSRTFRWFARSPFHAGFRYRAYDPNGGAWNAAPAGGLVVVYSSAMRRAEGLRVASAGAATALRETAPVRLGARTEATPAPATESAIQPVATSPSPEPSDELLYVGVADTSRKYYVPRYLLDVQAVSGQQRYRIAMVQGETSATLEVNLVATAAPAIADSARDAAEYPHDVSVRLEYLVAPPAGATKTLQLTDLTRSGAYVKAVLTFATLEERDEVYRALTETQRRARLIVQRFIDVSVPQSGAVPPGVPPRLLLPLRPIAALPIAMARPLLLAVPVAAAPAPARSPGPSRAPAFATEEAALGAVAMVAARATMGPSPLPAMRAVAVGAVLAPPPLFVSKLPQPQLELVGLDQDDGGTRISLCIRNWADFPNDFFSAAGDLPAGGAARIASRTWIDVRDADTKATLYNLCTTTSAAQLSRFAFTLPAASPTPRQLYVTLTDRRMKLARDSNAVRISAPVPPAPPMLTMRTALEQDVAPTPFAFAPAIHGYIFQGLTPVGGDSGLIRYRLQWQGGFHSYLQDASRPSLVYCFPDRFKIARRREAPFTPFATVRVSSKPDGSTSVVFDYVVAPHTDARRLEDARAQLLADPRFGAHQLDFQPFTTSDVRYYIDRPTRTGSAQEQRLDAALVLQGALKDTLEMPLDDFQVLFDAMQRSSATLFMGHVDIDVPHGDTEVIPFEAHMDDLEGEMFSYEAACAQDGTFQVVVRNEIESPLDVQTLDATLVAGAVRVHGSIRPGVVPCTGLVPGATLTLTVAPDAALPAQPQPGVAFDLGGVTVRADPAAIWDAILDRGATEFFRMVTARAIASLFDPVTGREDERIMAILVAFEGGGTAQLDASTLSAQVRVDYPIDEVILRRAVGGTYRYSLTVVRANGTQDVDAQPREQSAQVFYVSVVR